MQTNQFRDFNPKSLWNCANQPNFSSLAWEEHCCIISALESGTWEAFKKLENRDKNRSSFIPCWDHTRIKLTTNDSTASDYIHANYVDGYKEKKKFICTQAPKINTLNDFWRMVWTENSRIIVMLLNVTPNNKYNYCQYWPLEDDGTLQAGQLTIRRIKVKIFSNYIATFLHLSHRSGVTRRICHFLYTDWAVDGLPNDVAEFYKFVLRVNQVRTSAVRATLKFNQNRLGPTIVHCETGIGRTGTFCAVDIALCQLMKTAMICLPKIVISIRQQRHSSVTTFELYFFCYRVLFHFLSLVSKKFLEQSIE